MATLIFAEFCEPDAGQEDVPRGYEIGEQLPAAWYVSYDIDGEQRAAGPGFSRRRDCEAAIEALKAKGVTAEMLDCACEPEEYEPLIRIMVEALQW